MSELQYFREINARFAALLLSLALLLSGCQKTADTSASESAGQSASTNQSDSDANSMPSKNNQSSMSNPKVTVGKATSSRSLRELSEEQGELSDTRCEKQFQNENGVCEVPNHPFPDSLKQKKSKDDSDNKP